MNDGQMNVTITPEKIPVIKAAAENMPAVDEYFDSTVPGVYIIPNELRYPLDIPIVQATNQ